MDYLKEQSKLGDLSDSDSISLSQISGITRFGKLDLTTWGSSGVIISSQVSS